MSEGLGWPFDLTPEESLKIIREVLDEMPEWLHSAVSQRIGVKVIEARVKASAPKCGSCGDPLGGNAGGWYSLIDDSEVCTVPRPASVFHEPVT